MGNANSLNVLHDATIHPENEVMKILLVDDHALFREGMKLLLVKLQPSATFIDAGNLDEALQAAASHDDIALALFDLGLPGVHGIDALTAFRQGNERVPTVVLSDSEDRQSMLDALSRGAMGFVPKAHTLESLHKAFKRVLDNDIFIPESVLNGARAVPCSRRPTPAASSRKLCDLGLSERQMQVLRLVMQGKSNKAIARDLCIAESTIKHHVKPILKSLNVTSRVGAILEVAKLGISLDHGAA